MALDSADKRSSAIGVALPWRGMFPLPDGALNQADRQHTLGIYRGITAISNVEINSNLFTNTHTFGAAVLTTAYEITGVKFSNVNTFGANVVARSDGAITGVKFTNVSTFGTAVLSTAVDVVGVLFSNTQTFGFNVVGAPPYEIISTLFTNTQTFGTAYLLQSGVGEAYTIKLYRSGYKIKL